MPRHPTRPPIPLDYQGPPIGRSSTPLSRFDPATLETIIKALISRFPPHRQPSMRRRVEHLRRSYGFARLLNPSKVAVWAAGILLAKESPTTTCDPIILLQHKAAALDQLGTLSTGRNPAHRKLVLRERLAPVLEAMARVPCACGNARVNLPPARVLDRGSPSLGPFVVEAVAWHHRRSPSTMRRLLAEAAAMLSKGRPR